MLEIALLHEQTYELISRVTHVRQNQQRFPATIARASLTDSGVTPPVYDRCMTSTIVDPQVLEAVDGVRVAIDRLAGLDLDAAAGDDVIALLEAHEQQSRRMAAVGVAVIDTIDQRGLSVR